LGAQSGIQISCRKEDFAGGRADLSMMSEGLELEISDFEAENATLEGDDLWQVVQIVIGGVPTVLVVGCLCLFMSLGRILLQGSIATNSVSPLSHQVDLRNVEVGI
jgi:hypothetical protein